MAVDGSGGRMAEREIDEIVAKMECALVFARVETARGGVVRLSKAELELFAHMETARNFMMSVLQSEKADRKLLSQFFGGDCIRISRIRAVLESVQVLWPNSGEPRLRACLNACESVEQVLGDLGLGFALRLAQAREKSRMEAAAAATVEHATTSRRSARWRPSMVLKTEFEGVAKEMDNSEPVTDAEPELKPTAAVPSLGLEQEDWADATTTCSAPSTARFDFSSAPSTARCEDSTSEYNCLSPLSARWQKKDLEEEEHEVREGLEEEHEEVEEEQEEQEVKEVENGEEQEEPGREEASQNKEEKDEEEDEVEQWRGDEPQLPIDHGEGGELQHAPDQGLATEEAEEAASESSSESTCEGKKRSRRARQEPDTVPPPEVLELSAGATQAMASRAPRRPLLQPRPDEDRSAFEVSALEPWLYSLLERIFAFYASPGACLGLTKFRCFLRDAGLIAAQAEATTHQKGGSASTEEAAAAPLTMAQADFVYVQAKAGQGGMPLEAFLSAISDVAWLCRKKGNPEDGIQRFCENLIAPLAPHVGSGEEELRLAEGLLATAEVSAMIRRGNRGLEAVFGKYASDGAPETGGRRGRWTMLGMKRFASDLDMMGEVSHNILQRLFDSCVHFEVSNGRSSGSASLSFTGFKLMLVMLAQRLRGMPEDTAVTRLCHLVLRLSVVKGAGDLSEAACLILGNGDNRVPGRRSRQMQKGRPRVALRLGR